MALGCGQSMAPPSDAIHELHNTGWTTINSKSGFPEWEIFALVEQAHAEHSERIVALLKELQHLELEGDLQNPLHGGGRAGALVASTVTKKLESDGKSSP